MTNFVVTTPNDEDDFNPTVAAPGGTGLSLREANFLANITPGADTITFANTLTSDTINLTLGQIDLSTDVVINGDIDGDGVFDITLDAGGQSRVMQAVSGTQELVSLWLRGGNAVGAQDSGFGGALHIHQDTEVTLTNSIVSDSTAQFDGGNIYNMGTLNLTASTLMNGATQGRGGALNNADGAIANVTNVTVHGSEAALEGGGIYTLGLMRLLNTTITSNEAGTHGGGFYTEGSTGLQNSIVLGNTAGTSGANTAGAFIGNASLSFEVQGQVYPLIVFDELNADGGGRIDDNGGPVPTVALRRSATNPAIDAGDDTVAPLLDVIGNPREDVGAVANNGSNITDLGALEMQGAEARSLVVTTALDVADPFDGLTSLREAIAFANDPAAGSGRTGDADGDGTDNDTITFAAGLAGSTILMGDQTFAIESDITINGDIDGDGTADIEVNGAGLYRLFNVTGGTSTLEGLTLSNGKESSGGGVNVMAGAALTVRNSEFVDNHDRFNPITNAPTAGAIYNAGTLTVESTNFRGNDALSGDNIVNAASGIVTVSGALIEGGDLLDNYGDASLFDVVWRGQANPPLDEVIENGVFATLNLSRANISGWAPDTAAIVNFGAAIIRNSSFTDGGQALYNAGEMIGTEVTIANNVITQSPPVGREYIIDNNGPSLSLTNATIAGNTGYRGILSAGEGATPDTTTLTNSTVTGNFTFFGGAVELEDPIHKTNLVNSIVLGNYAVGPTGGLVEANIGGNGTSQPLSNLSVVNSITGANGENAADVFDSLTQISYQTFTAPGGGTLGNNGGTLQTVLLNGNPANPALDAGDDTRARPQDAALDTRVDLPGVANNGTAISDLGALERQRLRDPEAPSLHVTTTRDIIDPYDHLTSLREALNFANDDTAGLNGDGDADGEDGNRDTITFASGPGEAFENGGRIVMDNTYNGVSQLGEFDIYSWVKIDGDVDGDGSPDVELNGARNTRVLTITSPQSVGQLHGLIIADGQVSSDAVGAGIGVGHASTLMLSNSIVRDNHSMGSHGGGITAIGKVIIENSAILDNTAAGDGGGLHLRFEAHIRNSVIAGNTAGGTGGGIYNNVGPYGTRTLELKSSTVTGNSADTGGGVSTFTDGTTFAITEISDSIVLGNTATTSGPEIEGPVVLAGPSILGGVAPASVFAAVDAQGGGVVDMAGAPVPLVALNPNPANPALDAGRLTQYPTDITGLPRVDIAGVANNGPSISDLGAVELRPGAPGPGIKLTQTFSDTTVFEGGLGDGFDLALNTTPSAGVEVTLTPDAQIDIGAGGGVARTFVFTSTTPQTVTVAAVDDSAVEGQHGAAIAFSVTSTDPDYQSVTLPDLAVAVIDNDDLAPAKAVSLFADATEATWLGDFDTLQDALSVAVAGGAIRINDADEIGGAGAHIVPIEGLTIIGDAPFAAAFELGSGVQDLSVSGAANASVTGNGLANRIVGGAGNDTLSGRVGDDILDDGAGNDALEGGDGFDRFMASAGDDWIDGGTLADLFNASRETETIAVDLGSGIAFGLSTGTDTLVSIENVQGSSAGDSVAGSGARNIIFGLDGDDSLSGDGGDDLLAGGDGDDILSGDAGADELHGGNGNDTLHVDARDTIISGGTGRDWVIGDSSAGALALDLIASRVEVATGTALDDVLTASMSSQRLVIFGNDGADTLSTSNGSDFVLGERGDDTIVASGGNDLLVGGLGADTLSGGGGSDRFIYKVDAESGVGTGNRDIIQDFVSGIDKLILRDTSFNAYGGETNVFAGSNVLILDGDILKGTLDGTTTAFEIDMNGVTDLSASDFSF